MTKRVVRKALGRFSIFAVLALTAACARQPAGTADIQIGLPEGIDLDKRAFALREVDIKHQNGQRVWCVPFARNASGVQIRGDAHTWWGKAKGLYDRSKTPQPGAVMAFASTKGMTRGHVAVVSKVVSPREIMIDHANWVRNKVSLGMSVIDVSERGDWSAVKVMSTPGAYGKTYPVNGFILPEQSDS
ncbi:CHAP domain-containing protein [Tropicibacter oceani]|uniref:CHAP domain-containing protein n=1 Tax=Tropicibacter oceani TaxID=3058420 RepID=A0ABY8QFH8_9RHOB|nr:CHAP domain-containing protein [Tropicibacter oceani]WGW03295.1 CHAP domain-containing protein [Tropicibacter oceani]